MTERTLLDASLLNQFFDCGLHVLRTYFCKGNVVLNFEQWIHGYYYYPVAAPDSLVTPQSGDNPEGVSGTEPQPPTEGLAPSTHLLLNAALTVTAILLLKMDGPPVVDCLVAGLFAIGGSTCIFSRADLRNVPLEHARSAAYARRLLLSFLLLNIAGVAAAIWITVTPAGTPEESDVVSLSLLRGRSREFA